jgi:hypothetical protein
MLAKVTAISRNVVWIPDNPKRTEGTKEGAHKY